MCGPVWSQQDPVFCVSHALFLVASFAGENHSVFKTRLNQLPWIFNSHNPENCDRPFVSVGTVHSEPGFPSSRMPRYSASSNCSVHIFCTAGTRAELCYWIFWILAKDSVHRFLSAFKDGKETGVRRGRGCRRKPFLKTFSLGFYNCILYNILLYFCLEVQI